LLLLQVIKKERGRNWLSLPQSTEYGCGSSSSPAVILNQQHCSK